MQVIGYNVSPRDIWSDITNIRPYNGRTTSQFTDAILKPNLSAINAISSYPLEGALRIVNSQNQESVLQILDALPQWEKASKIINGSGLAIGWDLETIGDITHQGTYDGYATITEFGIGRRVYENGVMSSSDAMSFAFGTNQKQTMALESLISKFEKSGWDSLSNPEQVTLDRLSKIGNLPTFNDVFVSRNDTILGNSYYWTVRKLGESSMNPTVMRTGAKRLQALYNSGGRPEDIIPRLTNIVSQAVQSDNSILFGANSIFDVTSLEQTSKRLGINTNVNFRNIYDNSVDIVNAVRAMATSKGQSVLSFTNAMHGITPSDTDRAASVESIMESLRMNRDQTHFGAEDIINEGDILATRYYNQNKSFIDSLLEMTGEAESIGIYDVDINKSLFLVNRGHINQAVSDMAVIDGEPIPQSYSMANEYWRINTEKTGFATVMDGEGNAQERFILSFINPADKSVEIHKEFESSNDAINFLRKNTTWISEDAITQKQINEQHVMGFIDKGRREYDKFFDPLAVRTNKGQDEYGFAGLKRYLDFTDKLDELDGFGNKTARPSLVSKLHEVSDSPLKSRYQEQAFTGMYERLSEEKELLRYITEQIDAVMPDANNITKTIALQKAYNNTQDYLTSQYIAFSPKETYYGLSDVFGIDIQVGDTIKRVNAQTVDSATTGLRNVFKDMSAQEAKNIIQELGDRKLLTADQISFLNHSIDLSFHPNAGNNNFIVDVANQLVGITDRFNTSANAIDDFRQIVLDGSDIRIANKNIQSIADNLYAGAASRFRLQDGERFFQTSTLFKRKDVKEAIRSRIAESLSNSTSMTFYDGTMQDSAIGQLATRLNLNDQEKVLVEEMFNKHWLNTDGKAVYSKYAINSSDNIKRGLQSFVVMPESNSNAYIVLTNNKHSNNVVDILSQLSDDIDYNGMKNALDDHATVLELHELNKTSLSDPLSDSVSKVMGSEQATLVTINQSKNYEKFLTPVFDVYKDKNGIINASIRTGGEDLLSSYRLSGERIIEAVLNDEFDRGSSLMRRTQNAKLQELSAPSSYRGYIDPVTGSVTRIANYHPADLLHAYEMNVSGLKTLIEEMAVEAPEGEYNAVQKMLYAFNEQQQIVNSKNLRTAQGIANYRTIVRSNQFNEFFVKNLFNSNISSDAAMEALSRVPTEMGGYTVGYFDKSILQLMQDVVAQDTVNARYAKTVRENLSTLGDTLSHINQLLPESAVKHGLISFMKPGAFNDAAGLFSTMRPTYHQQNRPMYFDVGDISKAITEDGYTVLNSSSMTRAEYFIKEALADKLTTPGGNAFNSQRRAIATRFKQISDAGLQLKYLEASKDIAGLASQLGLDDVEKTRMTLEYMRQDMSSVYEGKWFLDPTLGNEPFFQQPDAKKVEFNIDAIDERKTRNILHDLFINDTTLDSSTVIAQTKNGQPIFYQGPQGRLTVENVDELLSTGRTYMLPDKASISDIKLMIGSEKATAHTISMKNFMAYTGMQMEEASVYVHKMFQHLFDGATVAGNIANLKHNGNIATSSIWTAIKLEYQRAGKTDELVKMIRNDSDLNRYFADWQLGVGKNNMLVVENTDVKYLDEAIIQLERAIREGRAGNSTVNANIVKILNENIAKNLASIELQRVHMNEHLSNQFRLDQRIEQAIRMRNQEYLTGPNAVDGIIDGINGRIINGQGYSWDDLYIDTTKAHALSPDLGTSKGFLNDDLATIRQISDIYNTERLASVRNYNRGVLSNRENIKGVVEALQYYEDPNAFKKGNIVTVTVKDFIDNDNIPKSGVSAEELEEFIFKVDGKYSKWLQELAEKQGVELDEKSLGVFFDFGQTVKYGGKEYTGAMIPMQNVIKNIDDEQFFVDSQRNITRFINEVVESTKNPGSKSMSGILGTFIEQLSSEIAIMKKDSDAYKAFGKISLPNAGQFLAQDEIPAIIDEMLSPKMTGLRAEQVRLQELIRNGDLSVIDELNKTNIRISEELEKLADSIRTGNLSPFTSITNQNLRNASILDIGGKKYYNNAVALGEAGFKKLGFDFGQAGMDLIYDLEARGKAGYTSHIPGIDKFSIMPDEIDTIARRINDLGIDGINITDADLQKNGLMKTLNSQMQANFGIDDMISTRTVNQSIINGDIQRIFGTFDSLGKRYASEIGLFGEHLRYPSFGGQPAVNVLLDETIEGEQIRYLNPVFSIHTNVDFDGDTGFLRLLLDGGSIGKFGVTDGLDYLYKSYLSGVTKGNNLIADLIEDGEAFKVDAINDIDAQLANKLKAFKEDEYWDAVAQWAKRNNVSYKGNIRDIEDEAFLYAANHSSVMRSAWSRAGFNTLTEADIIKASLTPALRKSNIGIISTPNFSLRDTLQTFVKNPELSNEDRKKVSLILSDLTNMRTKERGLLSLTEQKGIDVKHLIDSYNIAETPRWSLGLNQLFNLKDVSDIEKATGITNMIKASNHVLFKASDGEIKEIVDRIMSTSYESYNGLIQGAEGKTAKNLLYEKWFRGLYEFSQMDGAAAAFHAGIKTGSWDDSMKTLISMARKGEYESIYGTVENSFMEAFMEAYSDQYLLFDKNTVYFRAGDLDSVSDSGYIFTGMKNGKAYFDEVSLDYNNRDNFIVKKIGEETFGDSSIKEGNRIGYINKKASAFFNAGQVNIHALKEDSSLMSQPLRTTKVHNTLNDIVLNSDRFNKFLNMNDTIKKDFGNAYDDVLGLFGGNVDQAKIVHQNIQDIAQTYKVAMASARKKQSFESLIRQLNKDIVNNPDKYANSTIDLLIKDRIYSEIGGAEAFSRAHARRLSVGNDFDWESFNASLDFLNNELYDIIGEEQRLDKTYEAIKQNISSIDEKKRGPLQDIINSQQRTVSSVLDTIKAKNTQTIQTTQDRIYALFDSTSQMDKFFRWNDKPTAQTLVGFGEYINTSFGSLSKDDIKAIRASAYSYSDEALAAMPAFQSHAIRQTRIALDNYKPDVTTIKATLTKTYTHLSDDVQKVIDINNGTLNRILDSMDVDKATSTAKKSAQKRNTITSSFFDDVKRFAQENIKPKTVGVVAASLAAIGIVNNLLHNQKNQSPLTPVRRPDSNATSGYSENNSELRQQAPMSQRKVVYHDKGSGFNFKVSARTNSYIQDSNNAKLIGMSGGGQTSVYSQADMSGVTDNWLENKFAELV